MCPRRDVHWRNIVNAAAVAAAHAAQEEVKNTAEMTFGVELVAQGLFEPAQDCHSIEPVLQMISRCIHAGIQGPTVIPVSKAV